MGNGTKHTPDAPKARPFRALADLTGKSLPTPGFDVQLAVDYCEVPRELDFEATPRTQVNVGDIVRLRAGDVPYVANPDGEVIGTVTDGQATAVRQCLLDGYAMTGTVTAFDCGTRNGRIEVVGRHA